MAEPGDDQRIEDVQREVHRAMETAMRARDLRTARALAQELKALGYAVSERTVTAWRSRESAIPAWALVAFSQVSGLSLDALLGQSEAESLAQTVARHERMLGEIQATLIEVCEKVEVEWHRAPAAGRQEERGQASG